MSNREEKESNFREAKRIVFRLFRFRPRSEKEIRCHLGEKNLPVETVDRIITYCKNLNFIDDASFAQQWMLSRLKKPFGLKRIKLELIEKGINQDIIEETLKNVPDHYNEEAIATTLARKQKLKRPHLGSEISNTRVYGYLTRRGFDTGVIMKVINKL